MFVSALIDVAGHAGKLDAAFEILEEAKAGGLSLGIISYSSLMGACCNVAKLQDDNRALDRLTKSKEAALLEAESCSDGFSKSILG